MILRGVNEIAPRGSRLLDAEVEEAQACLLNDGVAELQGRFDDNDADPVGEDVTEHDASIGGAEGARG